MSPLAVAVTIQSTSLAEAVSEICVQPSSAYTPLRCRERDPPVALSEADAEVLRTAPPTTADIDAANRDRRESSAVPSPQLHPTP